MDNQQQNNQTTHSAQTAAVAEAPRPQQATQAQAPAATPAPPAAPATAAPQQPAKGKEQAAPEAPQPAQQPQAQQAAAQPQAQPSLKKVTFGGFEKKSVLNYIYELNTTAKAAQDKLKSQLDEVSSSREKLGERIRDMESRLQTAQRERDNLSTELDGEKRRTGELAAMIDALQVQMKKQEKILEDKDKEIFDYKRLNNELLRKNQLLESKKDEVDKASAYVGELMLRTKTDSEQILADAAAQAGALVENAAKSLDKVHSQFGQFKQEVEALQTQMRAAMNAVQAQFDSIGDAVEEMDESLHQILPPQEGLAFSKDDDGDKQDFFRPAAENQQPFSTRQ